MPQLHEIIPDVETLISLEPEELGGVLLRVIDTRPPGSSHFHPGNFENELFSRTPVYPGEKQAQVLDAVREAISWLEGQALIIWPDSGNGRNGFRKLGRRGKRLADPKRWQEFQQARTLPRQLLHPTIADEVYFAFIRGTYDTAVFEAFKAVEVTVRAACRTLPAKLIGVDLMRAAFATDKGPLTDMQAPTAEREALGHLFAGAIGSYKNPHSHRDVKLSAADAVEMIVLASHLLKIVDARRRD